MQQFERLLEFAGKIRHYYEIQEIYPQEKGFLWTEEPILPSGETLDALRCWQILLRFLFMRLEKIN